MSTWALWLLYWNWPPNRPPCLQSQWVFETLNRSLRTCCLGMEAPSEGSQTARANTDIHTEGPQSWQRSLPCLCLLIPPLRPRSDHFSVSSPPWSLPLPSLLVKAECGGSAREGVQREEGSPGLYSPLQEAQRFSPNLVVWERPCLPRSPWSQGHRPRCNQTLGARQQENGMALGERRCYGCIAWQVY